MPHFEEHALMLVCLSFIDNITNSIESEIQDGVSSIAKDLGLHDFYSVHLMDYCEGYFVPSAVPNDTISRSDIHKNVTACANRTALFDFDPQQVLQRELNRSGHGDIHLSDLQWPESIDKGFNDLRITAKAMFVLYCIAIGFIVLALVAAVVGLFHSGTMTMVSNVIIDWLAFITIGVASAIATAIAVKGASIINKYGNEIGIAANKGTKFLVLTWVATGLMIIATFTWCFALFSHRRSESFRYTPKKG